jgi:hypothetical protein
MGGMKPHCLADEKYNYSQVMSDKHVDMAKIAWSQDQSRPYNGALDCQRTYARRKMDESL